MELSLNSYINTAALYIPEGKVHTRRGYVAPYGEKRYSSTLSLISALDGVDGQSHAPAAIPPEKTRHPLYETRWPQGRYGKVRKILPPPGFDPRTVQPVASRYTDWANPPMNSTIYIW